MEPFHFCPKPVIIFLHSLCSNLSVASKDFMNSQPALFSVNSLSVLCYLGLLTDITAQTLPSSDDKPEIISRYDIDCILYQLMSQNRLSVP